MVQTNPNYSIELQTRQSFKHVSPDGSGFQLDMDKVDAAPEVSRDISNTNITPFRANIVILQLSTVTFLTSVSTGLITVCIPRIAADLHIQPELYYW